LTLYIIRRLVQVIPTMIGIFTVLFILAFLMPGDPVRSVLGEEYKRMSPEVVEGVRDQLGLNDPFFVRYFRFLGQMVRLDLGKSFILKQDVWEIIGYRLPRTLQLMAGGMFVALLIGLPAGIIAAEKQYTWIDHALMVVALLGVSMPVFWLALLLSRFFGVTLKWFPVSGFGDTPLEHLHHLLLPALSTAIWVVPILVRNLRAALLDEMGRDYVTTGLSKGLGRRAVFRAHVFPNSLLPTVNLFGIIVAYLLGGSVIVESVYAVPGMGKLMVESILARDYYVVQGATLVFALTTILVMLATDLIAARLDPRVSA